jgi:serine/threonine protein kinase
VDKVLGEEVAFKILDKKQIVDWKALERFKRGIILTRKVSCPNICRIFEFGELEDGLYVVMEYIEGELLSDTIRSIGRMNPEQSLMIAKQILTALEAMHRVGVIHRNLEPANILITPDQDAYITDFETWMGPNVKTITGEGEVLSASAYVAPEQLEQQEADAQSDIYSLGVILYEMLTGRSPFQSKSVKQQVLARYDSPSLQSAAVPEIPSGLDRIILKARSANPQDRFQSASEFLEALEGFEKSLRVQTVVTPLMIHQEDSAVSTTVTPEEQYAAAFSEGKDLYDQSRLEEALDVWTRALELKPDDVVLKKCIVAVQNRMKVEAEVRAEVNSQLVECQSFLNLMQFSKVVEVLDECETLLARSSRLRDFRFQIQELRMNVLANMNQIPGPAEFRKLMNALQDLIQPGSDFGF